jgi:DNA polymerase-4
MGADALQRWIIHVDLDAFFASVEELLDPTLRGKPLIVGGSPEGRGVVAAASYAARAYGVHSAMPVAQALRLCPQLIIARGHYGAYGDYSDRVMAILHDFTPTVEQISIDEAFLDITGCEQLWGPPLEIARRIKQRVAAEVGLPISLGIAATKLVAKIACSQGKPNGLTLVLPGEEAAFLAPLAIEELWGVGKVTGARLRSFGLRTIGDLQRSGVERLTVLLGDAGQWLYRSAMGIDPSPVESGHGRRSISQETTFARDIAEREPLRQTILQMSDHLAAHLRRRGLVATTVRLKYRSAAFETYTRQSALEQPTDQAATINAIALQLLDANWTSGRPLRLLGVGVSGLLDDAGYQLSLFDDRDQRDIRLANALDEIRNRFGRGAITRASLLGKHRRHEPEAEEDS